jgi:hypothetical protein
LIAEAAACAAGVGSVFLSINPRNSGNLSLTEIKWPPRTCGTLPHPLEFIIYRLK